MAVAMTETEGTDWEEAVRTNADLIRKLVGLSKETINGELSPKQKHDRAMTLIDMDATLFDLETNLFDMVKEPVVATPDGPPEDNMEKEPVMATTQTDEAQIERKALVTEVHVGVAQALTGIEVLAHIHAWDELAEEWAKQEVLGIRYAVQNLASRYLDPGEMEVLIDEFFV